MLTACPHDLRSRRVDASPRAAPGQQETSRPLSPRTGSITSSASASRVAGKVSRSAFAVLPLITNSNLIDWTTGLMSYGADVAELNH
jgi:hypothetical protein